MGFQPSYAPFASDITLKLMLYIAVWVELKGIVGTARLRMQLIPDPPL